MVFIYYAEPAKVSAASKYMLIFIHLFLQKITSIHVVAIVFLLAKNDVLFSKQRKSVVSIVVSHTAAHHAVDTLMQSRKMPAVVFTLMPPLT